MYIYTHIYYMYKYLRFLRLHIMPLCFYERLTLVPVFANQKKSEEDFCF